MSIIFDQSIEYSEVVSNNKVNETLILYGTGPTFYIHPSDLEAVKLFESDFDYDQNIEICSKDVLPTAYSPTLFWILHNYKVNM